MLIALIFDQATLEWADLWIVAGLFVLYVALTIAFPGLALRPFFWVVTRTIYKIRTTGKPNVPMTGPALLLSNHVTFIDWLLVWKASPRKLRFVAWAGWTKNPIFKLVPEGDELDPHQWRRRAEADRQIAQEDHGRPGCGRGDLPVPRRGAVARRRGRCCPSAAASSGS